MLIDTGSAVSLVREDVWREATELPVDLLTPPVRPIVAANGGELDLRTNSSYKWEIYRCSSQSSLPGN